MLRRKSNKEKIKVLEGKIRYLFNVIAKLEIKQQEQENQIKILKAEIERLK